MATVLTEDEMMLLEIFYDVDRVTTIADLKHSYIYMDNDEYSARELTRNLILKLEKMDDDEFGYCFMSREKDWKMF